MEQTSIYLLAETLVNQNMRTHELTIAFQIFTILFYFFVVIITAYIIRNLYILVRLIATFVAILFNFILIYNIQIQSNLGNILLNSLSKLAAEDQAPLFKENLLKQGLDPGKEITILDPNLFNIYIITLLILGILAPVYLYLFAKWEKI